MSDLKPCPFCGNKYSLMSGEMAEGSYMLQPGFVFCCECGANISECKTEAKAIEAWNRRTEPERKWIPVTEALPEEDKDVLIQMDDGEMAVSQRRDMNYWDGYGRCGDIIAWMPLPEPWRGE